jgi:hypothetical protein
MAQAIYDPSVIDALINCSSSIEMLRLKQCSNYLNRAIIEDNLTNVSGNSYFFRLVGLEDGQSITHYKNKHRAFRDEVDIEFIKKSITTINLFDDVEFLKFFIDLTLTPCDHKSNHLGYRSSNSQALEQTPENSVMLCCMDISQQRLFVGFMSTRSPHKRIP